MGLRIECVDELGVGVPISGDGKTRPHIDIWVSFGIPEKFAVAASEDDWIAIDADFAIESRTASREPSALDARQVVDICRRCTRRAVALFTACGRRLADFIYHR